MTVGYKLYLIDDSTVSVGYREGYSASFMDLLLKWRNKVAGRKVITLSIPNKLYYQLGSSTWAVGFETVPDEIRLAELLGTDDKLTKIEVKGFLEDRNNIQMKDAFFDE